MINEDGYLKLIDFGLARLISKAEIANSFCGTPEYFSPEMIDGSGHSKPVDWWSLGILIYEMMIGVTPFYDKSRSLMLMKIQTSKIVFPNKEKYDVSYSDEC
jgi:serine/threonine protein kinase